MTTNAIVNLLGYRGWAFAVERPDDGGYVATFKKGNAILQSSECGMLDRAVLTAAIKVVSADPMACHTVAVSALESNP